MLIMIVMDISKCYFTEEHIALSSKNDLNIKLVKPTGELVVALRMMHNDTKKNNYVSITQDKAFENVNEKKCILQANCIK